MTMPPRFIRNVSTDKYEPGKQYLIKGSSILSRNPILMNENATIEDWRTHDKETQQKKLNFYQKLGVEPEQERNKRKAKQI